MLKYLIYAITQKNGSNLHNLCVNQKPVLYVLHHSGFNTCTKFQNFPILKTGVLVKKLRQFEPYFTISENKNGRWSAILDPILKSFDSKQWGTMVNISIQYSRTNLRLLLRKMSEKSNFTVFKNKDGRRSQQS